MNAYVKKEIRLLLPVWLAVLVLACVMPWIGSEGGDALMLAPVFTFFGIILLAVDSFGREFSQGTFAALLAQPIERRQIWRTKITVLAAAALVVFVVFYANCGTRILWYLAKVHPSAQTQQRYELERLHDFHIAMLISVALWFVALASGLWSVLLLRQASAAFWIAFLTPLGILATVFLCLPNDYAGNAWVMLPLLLGLALAYVGGGFWFARRLFYQAEDYAWTGGVVNFSKWRYFEQRQQRVADTRQQRPALALLRKEFQLHSISLFCAAALFVLHLMVILFRATYINSHQLSSTSFAQVLSESFWCIWLVMPLILGGMAVAEERKLGLEDSQFCLPVSRRRQFWLKLIPVTLGGTLLGGLAPGVIESTAAYFHVGVESFGNVIRSMSTSYYADFVRFQIFLMLGAAGLTWLSFLASTVTRNFLQALSLSIVLLVAGVFLAQFVPGMLHLGQGDEPLMLLGVLPWPSLMPLLIGVPTALGLFLWVLYRNFSWFREGWRLWRGNLLRIAGAIAFVFVLSALLYNRAWEVFQPAEPAHGPAKFSLANPPKMQSRFLEVQVHLPDGRVWVNSLDWPYRTSAATNRWQLVWQMLTDPRLGSAGPQQLVGGSNWMSVASGHEVSFNRTSANGKMELVQGYRDTVGVQSNGTLWISSRAVPDIWTGAAMIPVGNETNWSQVTRLWVGCLLLKNDGTLWRWDPGSNRVEWGEWQTNWPTVRHYPIRQIGTNTDWQNFQQGVYVQKKNGHVWTVDLNRLGMLEIVERTNLIFSPESPTFGTRANVAWIGTNGSLWIKECEQDESKNPRVFSWKVTGVGQVGSETNWVAVADDWPLVALKADGTLWKWNTPKKSTKEILEAPPKRLGIHSDWVALSSTWDGKLALAADGSLWYWPDSDHGWNWTDEHAEPLLLKFPKQPKFLGNVFAQAE